MRKLISVFFVIVLIMNFAWGQDVIWSEDFESDGNGSRYTASNTFRDGTQDYFFRTDGSDINISSGGYSNFNGAYFWAAEDTDDDGGDGNSEKIITFNTISSDMYKNITFSGLFAAGNENGTDNSVYDDEDYIQIEYSIDNGLTFSTGLSFRFVYTDDNSNEPISQDTDFNGYGDGAVLNSTFSYFNFSLPNSSTIIVRIKILMNSGGEEIAFDNFSITGTYDTSLPVTLSSFTGTSSNGTVEIAWTTESEVNNLGFYLYRSNIENGNFEKISEFIEGAGNSSTKNTYNFIDTDIIPGGTYYYQLEDVSTSGKTSKHEILSVVVENNISAKAEGFQLHAAYPNPCNPSTNIRFDVTKQAYISLRVFDLQGRLVKTLVSENQSAGSYSAIWDGTDKSNNPVGNGVYLYQLTSETGYCQTNKVILLK